MTTIAPTSDAAADQLFGRVAQILDQARGQVARTVNTAMVHAYWLIGREIVEVEPTAELQAELTRERDDAERVLQLTAAEPDEGGEP